MLMTLLKAAFVVVVVSVIVVVVSVIVVVVFVLQFWVLLLVLFNANPTIGEVDVNLELSWGCDNFT